LIFWVITNVATGLYAIDAIKMFGDIDGIEPSGDVGDNPEDQEKRAPWGS
jgi:hypothetical protein